MRFGWWWAGRTIARRPPTAGGRAGLLGLLLGGLLVATAIAPGDASGHALLKSSTPARGATLGEAPEGVSLSFTETPDLKLTSIRVLDSTGTDHVSGDVSADPSDALTVSAPIESLPDAVYTVSWRTVSAVDGHVSAGSFSFGVGTAPPTGPPGGGAPGGVSELGSPPAIGARWVLYLGLVMLIGAAFAAVAVSRRPAPDLLAMAALGWLLSAGGTAGVIAVQAIEVGAPLETLLSTSIGASALVRVAGIALVGGSLVAVALAMMAARRSWMLVLLASALALVIDVATGHAAAGDGWLVQVAVQSVHGLAAAAWVGGLAGLLVLLRTTPADERLATARRFSTWAGVCLVAVAATGVVRAVVEVGTVDALFSTDFGRVVLAKTAALLALAGLGAVNRFVNLRSAARVLSGLRRFGRAELVLAIGVLGLSALLVNLSPPASTVASPPAPRPIIALGSDFGTSVKVRLIGAPGLAGENDIDVTVVDYDTGEPVDATGIELRFELVSQANVEPSILALERTGPGRFGEHAQNLSIDGIYRVTATVTIPGGAVEVPLLLATTVPDQPVDVLVSPDLPTIYTVGLDEHGSAQVYLDPGRAGQNELHVTFFDTGGQALAVPAVTFVAVGEGGASFLPTPRQLDVGHFVATIDTGSGPLAVDIVGPLPDAVGPGQVHVHVTIEVQP